MSQWYCRIEGKLTGPYSSEEICFLRDRGKISRHTEVQCGEDGVWRAAGSVDAFFSSKTRAASDRHVSAGIKEARPSQTAAEQTATEQAPETARPVAMDQQRPAPPPAPTLAPQSDQGERLPRIAIGSIIVAGLLLLLGLIWLLLHLTANESRPVAIAHDAGGARGAVGQGSDGGAAASGSASSTASAAAASRSSDRPSEESASGQASQQDPSSDPSAADSDPPPSGDDSSAATPERESIGDQPPDDPARTALFQVTQLASELPPDEANGAGDRERTDPAEQAENGIDSPVKTIGGVKVKGKIALVCDVSGSMHADFPILVRELREKFPRDTPLLLVNGCNFSPPNPAAPPPLKLVEMHGRSPMMFQMPGVNLADDEHVYYANTTSDAIIFAVKELRRETVMFNNDLQDGGSIRAIDAFEDLRAEHPFVLSGRSLNCDAPKILHDFIEASGGEFKLDPIGRHPQPARPWY